MADKISIEGIAYIVERIVERAREAAVESRGDRRTEFDVREISLYRIGLDFDLERELL